MARLEAAIAARQQEEGEARMKREQEKEAAIRSEQKEKVSAASALPSSQCVGYLLQHCGAIKLCRTRDMKGMTKRRLCVPAMWEEVVNTPFIKLCDLTKMS